MSRFNIAYQLREMVSAPAGEATPKVIFKSEDGILICYGKTKPDDNSAGYAPGCLFLHIDGGNDTSFYFNEGTATLCDFNTVAIA